jgi:hypothetical protein
VGVLGRSWSSLPLTLRREHETAITAKKHLSGKYSTFDFTPFAKSGDSKRGEVMRLFEIRDRYQSKRNPFDLTIEKWICIRQFVDTTFTLSDYKTLFQAGNLTVPFCFEYQGKNCLG